MMYSVQKEDLSQTLAAFLRRKLSDRSWSAIRTLISSRHVRLNDELCLDPARRVKEGDKLEVLSRPLAKPHDAETIRVRYLDGHVVVVEKPSGINTVRHPAERAWNVERKELSPTLEDLVPKIIAKLEKRPCPRLRIVQRLDKETSGLVVFARSVDAERGLGRQFRKHTVVRRYLALVPGVLRGQTIRTRLVRDRGDGRRGSTTHASLGKEAITHVEVVERLPRHTLLACRLETGRTHQIRIHLAEFGHPVCGDKVYNRTADGKPVVDTSGAPRLALHATELGFRHPITDEEMHWEMPLPADLDAFLTRLRGEPKSHDD